MRKLACALAIEKFHSQGKESGSKLPQSKVAASRSCVQACRRLNSGLMAERRTVPRYMYGTKGRVHPPSGGAGRNVQIGVISTQGCSILGGEALSIGEKCEIYIDWHGTELGMQAQVANREPDGTLGLRFLSVDPHTQRRLSEVCTSLRIQPPTRQTPEIEHGPLPALRVPPPAPAAAPPLPRPPVRERRRVPRYVSELRAHITSSTGASTNVRVVTLSILGGCL